MLVEIIGLALDVDEPGRVLAALVTVGHAIVRLLPPAAIRRCCRLCQRETGMTQATGHEHAGAGKQCCKHLGKRYRMAEDVSHGTPSKTRWLLQDDVIDARIILGAFRAAATAGEREHARRQKAANQNRDDFRKQTHSTPPPSARRTPRAFDANLFADCNALCRKCTSVCALRIH